MTSLVKRLTISVFSLAAMLVLLLAGLWWWAGTEGSLATGLRWAGQSQPLTFEQQATQQAMSQALAESLKPAHLLLWPTV